jgi:hypothetical protein
MRANSHVHSPPIARTRAHTCARTHACTFTHTTIRFARTVHTHTQWQRSYDDTSGGRLIDTTREGVVIGSAMKGAARTMTYEDEDDTLLDTAIRD